ASQTEVCASVCIIRCAGSAVCDSKRTVAPFLCQFTNARDSYGGAVDGLSLKKISQPTRQEVSSGYASSG
ncbi:hypothetical protein, partial [Enterobacter intestinihominis]